MVQYAKLESKSAALSGEFGQSFLKRRFGDDLAAYILETLPKFSRGPRKGLIKGYIHWTKCNEGGWFRSGPSYHGSPVGRVIYPGTRDVFISLYSDPCAPHLFDDPADQPSSLTLDELKERFDFMMKRELAKVRP